MICAFLLFSICHDSFTLKICMYDFLLECGFAFKEPQFLLHLDQHYQSCSTRLNASFRYEVTKYIYSDTVVLLLLI